MSAALPKKNPRATSADGRRSPRSPPFCRHTLKKSQSCCLEAARQRCNHRHLKALSSPFLSASPTSCDGDLLSLITSGGRRRAGIGGWVLRTPYFSRHITSREDPLFFFVSRGLWSLIVPGIGAQDPRVVHATVHFCLMTIILVGSVIIGRLLGICERIDRIDFITPINHLLHRLYQMSLMDVSDVLHVSHCPSFSTYLDSSVCTYVCKYRHPCNTSMYIVHVCTHLWGTWTFFVLT